MAGSGAIYIYSFAVLLSPLFGLGVEGPFVSLPLLTSGGVDLGGGVVLVQESAHVFDAGSEAGGGDPGLESGDADGAVVLLHSTVPDLGLEGDVGDSVGEASSQVVADIELLALVGSAGGTSESEDEFAFNSTNVLFPGDTFVGAGSGPLKNLAI